VRQPLRDRFDQLLEEVIDSLPAPLRALLDEVPVVVEDLPSTQVLRELAMHDDEARDLCGLHTGTAFTDRSVEGLDLPSEIQLYREGIVEHAGGWGASPDPQDPDAHVRKEIRVTLLHEIGHQFGLDEDDLDKLGYA
jgi:predicted Zn-dependent protease with MMP-like domain